MSIKKIFGLVVFAAGIFFVARCILFLQPFFQGWHLQSSNGRVNILILGIGGGSHPGPDLTDTMIVVSIENKNHSIALISIPRDIWSDTLKDKINSAYTYGEQKRKGGGLVLAKATVEDVIGMPIQYGVVIDFSGFEKLIDEVGGVDVNVPDAFIDTQYPCENTSCVYKTIQFVAGWQHMDGARALIYARSRHAEGPEGSDFARSKRQQLIILALKDKMTHPASWITVSRIEALPTILSDATDTDMRFGEVARVGMLLTGIRSSDMKRISFEQLLVNPPAYLYNNLYVLVPQTSWEEIHNYINAQLSMGNAQ